MVCPPPVIGTAVLPTHAQATTTAEPECLGATTVSVVASIAFFSPDSERDGLLFSVLDINDTDDGSTIDWELTSNITSMSFPRSRGRLTVGQETEVNIVAIIDDTVSSGDEINDAYTVTLTHNAIIDGQLCQEQSSMVNGTVFIQ